MPDTAELAPTSVRRAGLIAERALAGINSRQAESAGVPLGAIIACYRSVREVLTPPLEIFRNTAPLAILPVFVLTLGIGQTSKIAIVCYACLFPILLNTASGVGQVNVQLLHTARVLGLSTTPSSTSRSRRCTPPS